MSRLPPASSSRSSQVSSLSGRVQGLKFMQRAAASVDATTRKVTDANDGFNGEGSTIVRHDEPSAFASPTTISTKTKSPNSSTLQSHPPNSSTKQQKNANSVLTHAENNNGHKRQIITLDGNEEHWVLPKTSSAATPTHMEAAATTSGSSSAGSIRIEPEHAWHAWISQRTTGSNSDDFDPPQTKQNSQEGSDSDDTDSAISSSFLFAAPRRTYGAWAQKQKKQERRRNNSESSVLTDEDADEAVKGKDTEDSDTYGETHSQMKGQRKKSTKSTTSKTTEKKKEKASKRRKPGNITSMTATENSTGFLRPYGLNTGEVVDVRKKQRR